MFPVICCEVLHYVVCGLCYAGMLCYALLPYGVICDMLCCVALHCDVKHCYVLCCAVMSCEVLLLPSDVMYCAVVPGFVLWCGVVLDHHSSWISCFWPQFIPYIYTSFTCSMSILNLIIQIPSKNKNISEHIWNSECIFIKTKCFGYKFAVLLLTPYKYLFCFYTVFHMHHVFLVAILWSNW